MESKAIKLNVGSGVRLMKGFINIDKFMTYDDILHGWETKKGPYSGAEIEFEDNGSHPQFLQADMCDTRLPDNYADYILMDNVIEHIAMDDIVYAMKEMHRILKPEGTICIITPDFNDICRQWLEHVGSKAGSFCDWETYRYLAETAFGNQCGEGEFHRCPMTPDLLNYFFLIFGFERINITYIPFLCGIPDYDGRRISLTDKVRSGTIMGQAMKANPAAYAGSLDFAVTDETKIKVPIGFGQPAGTPVPAWILDAIKSKAQTPELLERYQHFNETIFDGKLPSIPIVWAPVRDSIETLFLDCQDSTVPSNVMGVSGAKWNEFSENQTLLDGFILHDCLYISMGKGSISTPEFKARALELEQKTGLTILRPDERT